MGKKKKYDQVVIATHPDQIIKFFENITQEEYDIFSKIKYKKNIAYLHTDERLMPEKKKIWSSWNFISNDFSKQEATITYWMNRLQNLKIDTNVFVSLNPFIKPDKSKIYDKIIYEHPLFSFDSFAQQKKIQLIQGKYNIWYCGAYQGFGFHEDGIKSGISVSKKILKTYG